MGRVCIGIGKTVKMSFEGETCRKLAYGQNIDYSERNGPRSSSAPALGVNIIILKHVYLVYVADLR